MNEEMNQRHDAAIVAADWWAKRISGNDPHDNGDKSASSIFAMALADYGRKPLTAEQLNTFKEEVVKGIEEYPYNGEIDLYCDYGPGLILRKAADEASINHLNFPFKTGMFVSATEVRVKEGYGQPYETIWKKREETDAERIV